MKQLAISVGCILLVILAGCGAPKTVERIETDTTIDLSGEWNDTDSRQVSEAMIADCLNHPWIGRHTARSQGEEPCGHHWRHSQPQFRTYRGSYIRERY